MLSPIRWNLRIVPAVGISAGGYIAWRQPAAVWDEDDAREQVPDALSAVVGKPVHLWAPHVTSLAEVHRLATGSPRPVHRGARSR